jgi:hypothetical protein
MDRASTTDRGYSPSTAQRLCRVGPVTIKWVVPRIGLQRRHIWSSIPPHDNNGPRFTCHHLVGHSTSFISPLMPPPPRHPILGREHRSRRLLPVFVRHQPRHQLAQWLLHVHEDISHHACTIVLSSSNVLRLSSLRHVLPPQPVAPPTVASTSRLALFDAGTGRVGHAYGLSPCVSSKRTWWRLPCLGYLRNESSGLRYCITKARSMAAVGICYGVGGGVVSLRRVQGWEDTRILSPFSD